MAILERTHIVDGWTFKQADNGIENFLSVAQFPTNIHLDLLHHRKIPDPFLDRNEDDVQWIGEHPWIYRTTFPAPVSIGRKVVLVFEGLDTYATIVLNGDTLLKTDNMFLEYRIDITSSLRAQNDLVIRFESTFLIGKRLEKEWTNGDRFLCWNGDSSRLAVRKETCQYGWDWGPTLLTCGPWRPIYVETYTSKITDLSFGMEIPESLTSAIIDAIAEIEGTAEKVKFELLDPEGKAVLSEIVDVRNHSAKVRLVVNNPQLWYPIRYGPQSLYKLKATLLEENVKVDSVSKRIGLRRLELIQRPLLEKPGVTFFFQINMVPIFCVGSDWIPADSFIPRLTPEKYRAWIKLATDGHQNMIRVWGGGIYEEDVFYDICDEMGLLVWQDFMFACGSYPVEPSFLEQIKEEAIYNVRRTRHHPSLVLWCGNNEDHMFAEVHELEYDPSDKNPENWLKTNWPARYIYEKLLKDICNQYCPQIPYHFGSPWGGKISNASETGDMHSWKVWMADLEQYPYQDYPKLSGRFISEFGMKSYPPLRTIEEFITDPSERYPQSRTMDSHQKAPGDQRSIASYLADNFKHGWSMPDYVYATQLLQAEAMSYAFRSWRRQWKGPGREECAGSLVWQLNDCWPVVSWSLADHLIRPKCAYFTIKRDIAPLSVGVAREIVEEPRDEFTKVYITKRIKIEVWGSNLTLQEIQVELLVDAFDLATGRVIWTKRKEVNIMANRSTDFFKEIMPNTDQPYVVSARMIRGGEVLARFSDWPQPLKYLSLPTPDLNVLIKGDEIRISAPLPIKGLTFYLNDDSVKFGDNCIDLVPGDEQVIHVAGLQGRKLEIKHLGTATSE